MDCGLITLLFFVFIFIVCCIVAYQLGKESDQCASRNIAPIDLDEISRAQLDPLHSESRRLLREAANIIAKLEALH
jgi:hypothetical protein